VAYQDELSAVHLEEVEKTEIVLPIRAHSAMAGSSNTILLLFFTKAGDKIVETLEKKEY